MYCLHCGYCCKRMSPLSAPEPCPHLIERGTFVFCGIYDRRPEECRKHDFPARACPIGASMLDLTTSDALRKRIDDGFSMIANIRLHRPPGAAAEGGTVRGDVGQDTEEKR
jgi:hypothetical protein